jgi:ADP-heptose:LPS heptosyltransferase
MRSDLSARARRGEEKPRRIGFVWRADGWDPARSVRTELMTALFERLAPHGIASFSLQRGLAEAAPRTLPAEDIGSDDVLVTAARMKTLDLIVSVDTMAAHLAGALGVRCVTLLRQGCDWRWMTERADTPWYPTMRLVRVPRGGDWSDALAALEALLTPCRDESQDAHAPSRPTTKKMKKNKEDLDTPPS